MDIHTITKKEIEQLTLRELDVEELERQIGPVWELIESLRLASRPLSYEFMRQRITI
jgi:hypothetical protein